MCLFHLDAHLNLSFYINAHIDIGFHFLQVNVGGVSSTYRDSKSAPFHWRQDLSFSEVRAIQDACGPAMKYWGYVKAENASHQLVFNPIVNLTIICPEDVRRPYCVSTKS